MKLIPTNLMCVNHSNISVKNNDNKLCRYNMQCDNISFGRYADSGKLRELYKYGVPCMYTGRIMIYSPFIQKLLNHNFFQQQCSTVLTKIAKFCISMYPIEYKAFTTLEQKAKTNPENNLHDLMAKVVPFHERLLKKKQITVLNKIEKILCELPPEQFTQADKIMSDTYKKINGEPVFEEFSAKEFLYKFNKIIFNINKKGNTPKKKIMQLKQETDKLLIKDVENLSMYRKNIIDKAYKIFLSSSLADNDELTYLMNNAKASLNNEEIITSFSRKAFIYQLLQSVNESENPVLYKQILELTKELPTSRNNLSAYILKYSKKPSEQIAYMLLEPSFYSIEHIHPRSKGGEDKLTNYGGACRRANEDRQNINLEKQYKKRNRKKYTQMQVDRLIELANDGTFEKCNIEKEYITGFTDNIFINTNKKVKLDTSKLQAPKQK